MNCDSYKTLVWEKKFKMFVFFYLVFVCRNFILLKLSMTARISFYLFYFQYLKFYISRKAERKLYISTTDLELDVPLKFKRRQLYD